MLLSTLPTHPIFQDRVERIASLYKIRTTKGSVDTINPNSTQRSLLSDPHPFKIILKARQLGVTTIWALAYLDDCIFIPGTHAGIIADTREHSEEIFEDKIKFAYDNLPDVLKQAVPADRSNLRELRFANGSVYRVGTSMRSGTLQRLHISEFGRICKESPQKADEIISGSLNTVHPGMQVTIESTAEGRDGHFFRLATQAQRAAINGDVLGPTDFKFFFFPWYDDPNYRLPPTKEVTKQYSEYFDKLEKDHRIILAPDQKAWYMSKAEVQGPHMKKEYPSTPEEAFEAANEGLIYGQLMSQARNEGRIGRVPYERNTLVHTAWDLGYSDSTTIWFYQVVGASINLIDYYENRGEPLSHYIRQLKNKEYIYGQHYFPHDAVNIAGATGTNYVDIARELGLQINVLKKDDNINNGINRVRSILPRCCFDKEKCENGIRALENYRYAWNDRVGCYSDRPLHDWTSHCCDAMRGLSTAVEMSRQGAGMSATDWEAARRRYLRVA